MSLHKSLKTKNSLERRRNVLTRSERVEKLKDAEAWDEEGGSVFGLPKVKVTVRAAPRKKVKEKPDAVPEGAEATEEPGETTQ